MFGPRLMKKLDIIGPYPPPYGGISVHIRRLREQLERAGYDFMLYTSSGKLQEKGKSVQRIQSLKKWLIEYLLSSKSKILHLNTGSDWRMRLCCGLLCFVRRKKLVITLHGNDISWPWVINDDERLKKEVNFKGKVIRELVIAVLKNASFIIADNPKLKELALSIGVKPTKTATVSAFIPPIVGQSDYDRIPQCIWNFYRNHKPVISANGSIAYYKNDDLYGVDLMIELVKRLKRKYPDIGLIFSLCGVREKRYYKELKDRIGRYGITENMLLVQEELPEVYPLYKKSDVFVRPTNTDGDAMSIREALYFKTPVVASDACPRPDGVVLFKNRDVQDFIEKTKKVLDNYEEYKSKANNLDPGNGFDRILEIYNELAR